MEISPEAYARMNIEQLIGRDLDAAIVEHVLGWKLTTVSPGRVWIDKDCDGQNESEILTPDGKLPWGYGLPPSGNLHRGFLAPCFHERLDLVIDLAKQVGRTQIDITGELHDLPTLIARAILEERLTSHSAE